jgi:hypothetical protein
MLLQVRDVLTSWLNHVEDSVESEAVHKVSARDSAHLRVFAEMLTQYKQLMSSMPGARIFATEVCA